MAQTTKSPGMAIGQVVASTYEITTLLGEGGMGQVWAAKHLRLPGKTVAIKTLHAAVADDEALARFRREAEIASRLGHPNIVAVHDFNVLEGGTPYLVLEHLRGESLASRIDRGPLSLAEAKDILSQVGSALRAAHREGVIHRDLKPHNIFLCPREEGPPRAVVLDFGISKIRGSESIKTQTHAILGTPQYMSPEQATGEHDSVNATTDVFALGAIAYEMLSGQPAFSGQNVPEVVFKVVYKDPPPLAEVAPDVPAAVAEAVMKALAKKQADRFPDVTSFVEALTGEMLATGRRDAAALAETQAAPAAALAETALSAPAQKPLPAALAETTAAVNRSRFPTAKAVIAIGAVAVVAGAVLAWSAVSRDGGRKNERQAQVAATTGAGATAGDSTIPAPGTEPAPDPATDNSVTDPDPATDKSATEPDPGSDPGTEPDPVTETDPLTEPDPGTEPATDKSEPHPDPDKPGPNPVPDKPTPAPDRRLSPQTRALLARAETARRAGRHDEAFRQAFRAWRREPSSQGAFIIAYALCGQRRFGEVRAWYDRIRSPRGRRRVKRFCSRRGLDL